MIVQHHLLTDHQRPQVVDLHQNQTVDYRRHLVDQALRPTNLRQLRVDQHRLPASQHPVRSVEA